MSITTSGLKLASKLSFSEFRAALKHISDKGFKTWDEAIKAATDGDAFHKLKTAAEKVENVEEANDFILRTNNWIGRQWVSFKFGVKKAWDSIKNFFKSEGDDAAKTVAKTEPNAVTSPATKETLIEQINKFYDPARKLSAEEVSQYKNLGKASTLLKKEWQDLETILGKDKLADVDYLKRHQILPNFSNLVEPEVTFIKQHLPKITKKEYISEGDIARVHQILRKAKLTSGDYSKLKTLEEKLELTDAEFLELTKLETALKEAHKSSKVPA